MNAHRLRPGSPPRSPARGGSLGLLILGLVLFSGGVSAQEAPPRNTMAFDCLAIAKELDSEGEDSAGRDSEADCQHWVIEVNRSQWEEWHENADGRCWRTGKIIGSLRCIDAGKHHLTKDQGVGSAREEVPPGPSPRRRSRGETCDDELKRRPATRTQRFLHEGGGGQVVEERLERGKVKSTTEAFYDSQGLPYRATEKDDEDNTIHTSYKDGEANTIRQTDKTRITQRQWKKKNGRWFRLERTAWVEDANPPIPSDLPKLD